VILDAEGAECTLNGLFMGSGTQHIDNHTVIDHAKPHGVSRELYTGIMDGRSRGVFYGQDPGPPGRTEDRRHPDQQEPAAVAAGARQLHSPPSEIFADDVKCKHGATTGQLDAAALFYVRSRGIGEAQARALLTYAFASDVANRLRIPSIRETVLEELDLRLGGSFEEGLR